jgi:hypothetical protein
LLCKASFDLFLFENGETRALSEEKNGDEKFTYFISSNGRGAG